MATNPPISPSAYQPAATPSLSVVVPCLNSGTYMREHIASMQPWLDLAAEVIVVDSFSDDDTLKIVRENLHHPGLRILPHPRGLYQSWNYGIKHATSAWTYISTVGDGIDRAQLLHLLELTSLLDCDVVSSKPDFIDASGQAVEGERWPIDRIVAGLQLTGPAVLSGEAAFFFALLDAPMGLLGSAASNIYRTRQLQKNPFPTEFGHYGDGAWVIANAFRTRLAFTPRKGSHFRYHPKPHCAPKACAEDIFARYLALWQENLRQQPASDPRHSEGALPFAEAAEQVSKCFYARMELENLRKRHPAVWLLNPNAWAKRRARNEQRKKMRDFIEPVVEKIRRCHCRPLSPLAAKLG